MPQAIDLIVKNAAAVDKTFTLINPAAGNGGIADWALKDGSISSVFPRFSAMAKTNTVGRSLQMKYRIPSSYTDSVTGLTNVGSFVEWNVSVTVPSDFPENRKADALAFGSNLMAHAFVKSLLIDALPAT